MSLIPISDVNPTRRFPIVTVLIIVLNAIAFFSEPGLGGGIEGTEYFVEVAPAPCQLPEPDTCPDAVQLDPRLPPVEVPSRGLVSFFTATLFSTFLHAGFVHIIGNMLFLWVFGNNVEDFLGRGKFLAFYLLGGAAAALAHVITHSDSVAPTVGASGAVAAVMGAYLLLYPRARVNVLVPIFLFFTIVQMSALAVLGIWLLYQFVIAARELTGAVGVAWMAHVGGFVFGVIAILLLGGRPRRPQPAWQPGWY